jgi:hypothetical protein
MARAKRVISCELLEIQLAYRIKMHAGGWNIAWLLTLHVSYSDITSGYEVIGGLLFRTKYN